MNKHLYYFQWDCGRNGIIEGSFLATEEETKNLIGKIVYFGEVLGKHSDIHGTMEEDDISLLTDDQDFIAKAIEYQVVPFGINPFNYINDEDIG